MSNRFSRLELLRPAATHNSTAPDKTTLGTPVRSAAYHFGAAESFAHAGEFELALRSYTRALHEDRTLIAAWVGQVQMLVELGEYAEARLWADKSLEHFRNNGDLLASKARACVRMRDTRAALVSSDAAVAAPGSSPTRWLSRGEVMLMTSPARARDCFEKALNEPNTDWHHRLQVARIYLHHDRSSVAAEFATMAQEMSTRHAAPWTVLAQCHIHMGRKDRALSCIARSLELDPGNRIAKSVHSQIVASGRSRLIRHVLKGWFRR